MKENKKTQCFNILINKKTQPARKINQKPEPNQIRELFGEIRVFARVRPAGRRDSTKFITQTRTSVLISGADLYPRTHIHIHTVISHSRAIMRACYIAARRRTCTFDLCFSPGGGCSLSRCSTADRGTLPCVFGVDRGWPFAVGWSVAVLSDWCMRLRFPSVRWYGMRQFRVGFFSFGCIVTV